MKLFKCKHCGCIKNISMWLGMNKELLNGKKVYIPCPNCGKKSYYNLEEDKKK